MEVTESQTGLVTKLRRHIYPWRRYTIGVDGADAVGKSVLARYLAWELDMPTVETDLYIVPDAEPPAYRYADLARVIEARHRMNRPVIVEGVFLLDTLNRINVAPDFLILVNSDTDRGSEILRRALLTYREAFDPETRANLRFLAEYVDR